MGLEHGRLEENQQSGYFRAKVGLLIVNEEGLVLACERREREGAWQLPQGGIDIDEEPDHAAKREMREELGFSGRDARELVELEATSNCWFAYELPPSLWSEKHGRGQAQKFFAFRFRGTDGDLDRRIEASSEFGDWKWIKMTDLVTEAWEVRKPVYEAVAAAFEDLLAL